MIVMILFYFICFDLQYLLEHAKIIYIDSD